MKNKYNFLFAFCFFAVFSMMSCEKSELQKTTSAEEAQIEARTECINCPDTPEPHCCCAIELLEETAILNLQFCGTSGSKLSKEVCGPNEPIDTGCDYISEGYYWEITLDENNLSESFCMAPETAFMLKTLGGSGPVRMTCQVGDLTPQWVFKTLTFPSKLFFDVDDACEIDECP